MKKNSSLPFLLLLLFLSRPAWADQPQADGFDYTGFTHDPQLQELSGLAASHRHADVYWTHNDSGNPAELFAIKPDGTVLARVHVRGGGAFDWEDIASWVDDEGNPWLAIADTGDNFSIRKYVAVHLLPEPELNQTEARVTRSVHLRYEGGARDAESLAVDWPLRQFLLLDKNRHPATLFSAPMMQAEALARPVAEMPLLIPTPPPLVQPLGRRTRGTPVAMDLTADGRRLAVLTSRHVYFFERRAGETWQDATQHRERWRALPKLGGFEALAWDAAGQQVLVCNEGEWVHYYRTTPPPAETIKIPSDKPVPTDASDPVSTLHGSAHRPTAPAP